MTQGRAPLDLDPGPWTERGACRTHPRHVFFPPTNAPASEAAAKKICATCPVIDECRAYALHHREYGIWGGMTEAERLPTYRAGLGLPRVPHGSTSGFNWHRNQGEPPCDPCRLAKNEANRQSRMRRAS